MYLKITAILWLALSAQAVAAMGDCEVLSAVARVHGAYTRLAQTPAPQPGTRDARIISDEMHRLGTANLRWAVRDHPQMAQAEILVDVVVQAKVLSAIIARGNEVQFSTYLRNADTIAMLETAGRVLPLLQCDVAMPPPQTFASGQFTRSFTITPSITMFFAMLASAVTAIGGHLWFRRRANRIRRREKRHVTNIAAKLRLGGQICTADILDISCHGAKLRHGLPHAPRIGKQIAVSVCDELREGRVTWSNQFYCGVKFQRTLPMRVLNLAIHTPSPQNSKKRHPKGTAFL